MDGSADESLRADDKAQRIANLIARIDAHEIEGVEIDREIIALRLDTKRVKQIRAAKKTLDALMGIDPATADQVAK